MHASCFLMHGGTPVDVGPYPLLDTRSKGGQLFADYHSALQEMAEEGTTAQVHPQKLTQALLSHAEAKGARLLHGTVQGVALSADGTRVTGGDGLPLLVYMHRGEADSFCNSFSSKSHSSNSSRLTSRIILIAGVLGGRYIMRRHGCKPGEHDSISWSTLM